MSPNFLLIGATGNTGVGATRELSKLVKESKSFPNYGIIALTRSASSGTAKELAQLPNVTVKEKNWIEINVEWFKEHNVERLFIASHNGPTHFTDESLIFNYARLAGVKYAVRISTTASNVKPDIEVFYGRNHWAVETLLEQPQFDSLKWTSLRPNVFTGVSLQVLQAWLEKYRKTGEKDTLGIMIDGDNQTAIVDPAEVGITAAHLLVSDDYATKHASKKYTIVGPEDVTGKDLVKVLEKHAKTTVDKVNYRDLSWLDGMEKVGFPKYLLSSLGTAPRSGYNGECSTKNSPTSPELLELYKPKNGALQAIDAALGAM